MLSRRLVILALCLLLLVAIVHGTLGFGCYLVNEHRRLVWWEIIVLWTGDLISLGWFLRFVTRSDPSYDPSQTRRLPGRGLPRTAWLMLLSLTLGLIAELGMSLLVRHSEFKAFERAVPGAMTVTAVTPTGGGRGLFWKLDGQYADTVGVIHTTTFYVRDRDHLNRLPGEVKRRIRRGQAPLQLPIVFDPQRPGRSWIPQLGWDEGNRLHYLSLAVLFYQFMFALCFFYALYASIRNQRRIPWWAELHTVLPLAAEAFIFAMFGAIELYAVHRLCP